jgi:hypothetical protein
VGAFDGYFKLSHYAPTTVVSVFESRFLVVGTGVQRRGIQSPKYQMVTALAGLERVHNHPMGA